MDLADFTGRKVLLHFYPEAETAGRRSAAITALEPLIDAKRSWRTRSEASWFERGRSMPIGSAVQSSTTTQWKSRNMASRTVDSTHTLVVAPTKRSVSIPRSRSVASRSVAKKPLYRLL